jgi:hypothetical protein
MQLSSLHDQITVEKINTTSKPIPSKFIAQKCYFHLMKPKIGSSTKLLNMRLALYFPKTKIQKLNRILPVSLFLLLVLFGTKNTFAQSRDFLLLKRGANQKSQIRFYPGENITYKSDKLGYFITDKIVSLDQDFVYLSENILRIENIMEIDIQNKDPRNRTLRNLNALILGAGVILISVESINSIYQTENFSIDRGVGITSAILIGTGLALLPLRYKTFKNEGRNKIQIIQMRMD